MFDLVDFSPILGFDTGTFGLFGYAVAALGPFITLIVSRMMTIP